MVSGKSFYVNVELVVEYVRVRGYVILGDFVPISWRKSLFGFFRNGTLTRGREYNYIMIDIEEGR